MGILLWLNIQGALLIKNLAAREPSALGLDTYYKQYYLCLASASATIKWYFQSLCYFISKSSHVSRVGMAACFRVCHLFFTDDVYVSITKGLSEGKKNLRFKIINYLVI